jgi:MFS family permease
LVLADWGRAIVLGSIPIAYLLNLLTLAQLYAVSFIVGALTVLFDVSYQSYLPSLVERSEIPEGNTKLEISRSSADVAGPGIAGILVSAFTAPYAIIADAASFAGSALFLHRIRRSEEAPERSRSARRRMMAEIGEGLRFVIHHPILRPYTGFIATSNFFTNLLFSVLIVYAVRELHLSPATIGLIFSVGNIGSLIGALSANRLAKRFGIGPTLTGIAAVGGCGLIFVPLASGGLAVPFLVAALLALSIYIVVYYVTAISLIQAITPDRLLGRTNASRRFVVWGVIPLGRLLGGGLGSTIGLRGATWVGAVGASLAVLWLLNSPLRTIRTIEDAEELAAPAASLRPSSGS